MWDIVLGNYLLWINFLIPFGLGLYLLTTHQEYTLKEFSAQMGLTFAVLVVVFLVVFASQDITTKSYISGKVQKFVYEEEWTELVYYQEQVCSGSANTRTCISVPRTREDFHSDSFFIKHDLGYTYISEAQYNRAKYKFGFKQTDSGHSGQISIGDGRTYQVTPNEIIPVVDTSSSINYIYSAKTNIIKSNTYLGLEKQYKKELKDYPKIEEGVYGEAVIQRVFNKHLINPTIAYAYNKKLNEFNAIYGKSKEVNAVLYLTSAPNREMAYVVKGFLKDKYKNDAVLVMGVDANGSMLWSEAFGLTKNANFFVQNRDATLDEFLNNTVAHWTRTSMEEYKYLANDIELPVWVQVLVVFLNLVGSFFLFRFMIE